MFLAQSYINRSFPRDCHYQPSATFNHLLSSINCYPEPLVNFNYHRSSTAFCSHSPVCLTEPRVIFETLLFKAVGSALAHSAPAASTHTAMHTGAATVAGVRSAGTLVWCRSSNRHRSSRHHPSRRGKTKGGENKARRNGTSNRRRD